MRHGAQHRGLKCGGDQDQLAELQKTRAARLPDRHQLWEGAPFEEVEEIGPLVRRWRDIELVAGHEGVSPRSDQSRGACKEVGLIQDVEAVGFIGADPGIVAEIERALAGEDLGFAALRVRYDAVLDQERGGVETAKQNEALLGVLDTQAAQGLARGGEQLQCIARRQLEPARDAEPTAGAQALKVLLKSLHRVDVGFAEAVHPRGGCESIQQRNLHDIPLVRG
jgi:hypothetical protein